LTSTPKHILVLFPNAWDRDALAHPKYKGEVVFHFHGNDLFSFPGTLQLITFDSNRFIQDVVDQWRDQPLDGVLSTDEYIGAICAAGIARELGLAGADPGHIVLAQHKYYSRMAQREVIPEAAPGCTLIPLLGVQEADLAIDFPMFVKPVKGTFSVFAALVNNIDELREHLRFNVLERLAIKRVTRPFNQLLRRYTDLEHNADFFTGEGLMKGLQVTVDGFVWDGEVVPTGVVDSVMFPGTNTFERFEYPSRLPKAVQARMFDLTKRMVSRLGFDQLQFNVEFFWDRESDELGVIEINPRMSYQFADLFEFVDGSNSYDILLDLTLGRRPRFERGAGEFNFSASFVGRTFDGRKLKRVPGEEHVQQFRDDYDEATIKIYGKQGTSLKSEMRALGSYRYAIINVAAQSLLELFAIHEDSREQLPFETE